MVTVVLSYSVCTMPEVEVVAVRNCHILTVAQANAVLCTMANDPALRCDVDISILFVGNHSFYDTVQVTASMANQQDIIGALLGKMARYFHAQDCVKERNIILCLLGAIALDEAE